jgi:hypothetical protein
MSLALISSPHQHGQVEAVGLHRVLQVLVEDLENKKMVINENYFEFNYRQASHLCFILCVSGVFHRRKVVLDQNGGYK